MFSERFVAATKEYCTFEKHIAAPYMRKTFQLEALPRKCNLTICGLGIYRLYVNGKDITYSYFAPYISNPDDVLYYNQYDILEHLQVGKNAITVLLGNGFLNNLGGFVWFFDEAGFRSAPKTAFSLDIDGQIMEADESVRIHPSAITFDDIRAGERYDARMEIPNCTEADFDDSSWECAYIAETPKGEKRLNKIEPIRVTQEIKPVSISEGFDGYIYDFGINTAGIFRLELNGKSGQQIKLTFSEIVNDGKADMENISFEGYTLPDYNQCVIYTCKEGKNVYQPSFCYMGYRYVHVSGITKEQAQHSLLTMLKMHSDIEKVCDFQCSDPVVNQLYKNTENSILSNFYFFPTDCPQREKNGWTGDAHLCAEIIMLNYKAEKSFREWLFNIRKAQLENGKVPCVIPTTGWGYEWGPGPAWDAAIVEIPYRIYQYTGQIAIFEENADCIFAYIQYMDSNRMEDGLLAYGLGDWCQVNLDSVLNYTTPLCVSDTLIGMSICKKAGALYWKIGQHDRALYCEKLYDELKQSFREHCILDDFTVFGNTQTGQAMAMFYGGFEEEEKEQALEVLIQLIREKDDHFDVGVAGNRVLYRVLADMGQMELAYKLIVQPSFPSFGYQINMGATSLWESFYELGEDFKPVDGRKIDILSQNHYFWGDISAFFVEYFGGLQINAEVDNIKHICIKPYPVKGITWAKCHREMPYGTVAVEWENKNEEFCLKVQIPNGVMGEVHMPNGKVIELVSGNTEYRC